MRSTCIITQFNTKGVRLYPIKDKVGYESQSPLSEPDISLLKQYKGVIISHLYGLDLAQEGEVVLTPSGYGSILEIQTSQSRVHTVFAKRQTSGIFYVWDINPVINLKVVKTYIPVPLDKRKWGDCLIKGLEIVSKYREDKPLRLNSNKQIIDYGNLLECDWDQLTHWQFKIRLSQYLNSYTGSESE